MKIEDKTNRDLAVESKNTHENQENAWRFY